MSRQSQRWKELLELRGLTPEVACPECSGTGVKSYPNTTTWTGGIGGQAITNDVCDKCWGSGHKDKPWPSHRVYRNLMKRHEQEEADDE